MRGYIRRGPDGVSGTRGSRPVGGLYMHDTSTAAYSGSRTTIGCPHCKSVLKIRSSRQISTILRQIVFACQSDDCCATFGGDLTLTHMISPGAKPDPAVKMRTTPPRRRAANDDQPADRPADPVHHLVGVLPVAANDDVHERAVE